MVVVAQIYMIKLHEPVPEYMRTAHTGVYVKLWKSEGLCLY